MANKCIRALVTGRVQGVFFRDSTRNIALKNQITGHAKNLSDGRVEVIACGEGVDIDYLTGWLHSGPDFARVDDVQIEVININPPTGFNIR